MDCHLIGHGSEVGREPRGAGGVALIDASVSTRHVVFHFRGEACFITDMVSSNGTFLNGQRISTSVVRGGDVIRCGSTLFVVSEGPCPDFSDFSSCGLVGASSKAAAEYLRAKRWAATDRPALILGETGVGKDVVAQAIHKWSGRSGPFVPVNCGAVPESLAESIWFGVEKGAHSGADRETPGLFRSADRGTLFLDELAEMPAALQVHLNRVLENGRVRPVGATKEVTIDVRVVAATNRTDVMSSSGANLRTDLLARLEDTVLCLPPLRERKEDVIPIVIATARSMGFGHEAFAVDFLECALLHSWPRNVRQLVKFVRCVLDFAAPRGQVTLGNLRESTVICPDGFLREGLMSLPAEDATPLSTGTGEAMADKLSAALVRNGGNLSAAAVEVGVSRQHAYRLLRRKQGNVTSGPQDE